METTQCVVCGKPYPKEDGLHTRNGRHFFTCSDTCQKVFKEKGGLVGLLKRERAARKE